MPAETEKKDEKKLDVEEYPRMLYKLVPKPKPVDPAEPEEELQSIVVQNEEELKKKTGEGWGKDVPKSKLETHTPPKVETHGAPPHAEEAKKK